MRQFTVFSALALLFISSKVFCQEAPTPRRFELRIASNYAVQNYNLEGDGFKASDGGSSGQGVSGDLFWKRADSAFHVKYQTLSHEVTAPAGLTPTKVDTKWERSLLNYETESSNHVIYQIGIDHRSRTATETTPNIFMPTQTRTGLRFGLAYGHSLDEIFRYEFGGGLMLPISITESTTSTGNYHISANPDLNFDFIYKVNHFIDFSLGVHWVMEMTTFAGTGARSTVETTETFQNFYFPVQLRFQF